MATGGFHNKVALVTGSATGIGKAIACELGARGARVMVHGAPGQGEVAAAVAKSLQKEHRCEVDVQLAPLEQPEACTVLIEAVVARFGRLDLLVNNAGISPRADLAATDDSFFDRVIQVNLRAPLLLIRAALPHFRRQGGGRVLNIGSINAYCGEASLLAYSISKGGLTTMTRNLADAHGRDGLRVNQLNPGWVLTDNEYRTKLAEGLSADWPDRLPREHAPAGRIFHPEEIAKFAALFLSDDAELVNGSVVDLEQFPLIGRNPVKASGF